MNHSRGVSTTLDLTIFFLEKFQLLAWSLRFYFFLAVEKLYHPKLLVRYLHYADLSLLRQVEFCAFNMYIRIFPTGTKPEINAKLEHLIAVIQQLFSEKRSRFAILLGFGREVKKYKYPHATVLVESGEMVGFHYLNNVRTFQNIGCELVRPFICLQLPFGCP